jgi:hypothetical protein
MFADEEKKSSSWLYNFDKLIPAAVHVDKSIKMSFRLQ